MQLHEVISSDRERRGQGDVYLPCPACEERGTSTPNKLTMHVTHESDRSLFWCFRCEEGGQVTEDDKTKGGYEMKGKDLGDREVEWLKGRGITGAGTVNVVAGDVYFGEIGETVPAIGFLHPAGIKWRAMDQRAYTIEGKVKDFFLMDRLPKKIKRLVITEGEIDALSILEAGVDGSTGVVSVPHGAKSLKRNGVLGRLSEKIGDAEVVVATDADAEGRSCKNDLVAHFGHARCKIVNWPEGVKDANDVLSQGKELLGLIDRAKREKMPGIVRPLDLMKEINGIRTGGLQPGERIGLDSVDRLVSIMPTQMTVVTGIPGSGKSEWIDFVMWKLAEKGWKFLVFSAENPIPFHIAKLLEKRVGFSLNDTVSNELYEESVRWLDQHFRFFDSTVSSSLDSIFKRAVFMLEEDPGYKGLVIDPFNYIDPDTSGNTETQSISNTLTLIHRFAKKYNVHVFICAHPQKMYRGNGGNIPEVGPYDINGSAAWFNKTDFGISVSRLVEDPTMTQIHVWKCRFKWMGEVGKATLKYDASSGRYEDTFGSVESLEGIDWSGLGDESEEPSEEQVRIPF